MKNKVLLAICLITFLSAVSFALQKGGMIVKENSKNKLGADYYFTYNFIQRPTVGINILKVQIFDIKGNKNNSFVITGKTDMTEMSGMGSDEQPFKKNKKNDYLLPVDASMKGEWRVDLKFILKKAEYAKNTIKFNI